MDPGGVGAFIGISVMVFVVIVCTVRDRCQKRTVNESSRLVVKVPPPILVEKLLTKKQTSMRDFFKQNQAFSELKTIRIS